MQPRTIRLRSGRTLVILCICAAIFFFVLAFELGPVVQAVDAFSTAAGQCRRCGGPLTLLLALIFDFLSIIVEVVLLEVEVERTIVRVERGVILLISVRSVSTQQAPAVVGQQIRLAVGHALLQVEMVLMVLVGSEVVLGLVIDIVLLVVGVQGGEVLVVLAFATSEHTCAMGETGGGAVGLLAIATIEQVGVRVGLVGKSGVVIVVHVDFAVIAAAVGAKARESETIFVFLLVERLFHLAGLRALQVRELLPLGHMDMGAAARVVGLLALPRRVGERGLPIRVLLALLPLPPAAFLALPLPVHVQRGQQGLLLLDAPMTLQ